MWRDILLVAGGGIVGFGFGTLWCFCVCSHPEAPLPPLD